MASEIRGFMLRRLPLLSFILAALVIPLSCSSDEDKGIDGPDATGGGDDGPGLDPGNGMGGEASDAPVCQEFVGLGNCGTDAVTAEITPVNILLVLDKSGSMATPPEEDSDVSLWDATRTALGDALAEAPEAVSFGLQLYPARNLLPNCIDHHCCAMPEGDDLDVPIGKGEEPRAEIVRLLGRTAPGGGTPTAEALARAYRYFSTGEGAALEGDRFVLLATDGGPNCNADATCELETCTINLDNPDETQTQNRCANNRIGCLDDQGTLGQIDLLRGIGVDTFVVGLTGTEQYATQLDQFAEAGGRPRQGTPEKYFKVDAEGSAEGLTQVLLEITTQLVQSCDVRLAEAPRDPARVNVAVNCSVVPAGSSPEDPGGNEGGHGGGGGTMSVDPEDTSSYWWMDDSMDPPTIRLGGEICERIQNQGVERIDVLLGCPTVR